MCLLFVCVFVGFCGLKCDGTTDEIPNFVILCAKYCAVFNYVTIDSMFPAIHVYLIIVHMANQAYMCASAIGVW
jgi:hypothetical protein